MEDSDILDSHSPYWNLPRKYELLKGKENILDLLKPDQVQDAIDLFNRSKGTGVGLDEFPDDASMRRFIERAVVLTISEVGRPGFIGLLVCAPSPLCRSLQTRQVAFYMLMDELYRNKGCMAKLPQTMDGLAVVLGYTATSPRFRVDNNYNKLNASFGGKETFIATGVIPRSLLLKSGERMDDMMMYMDLTKCYTPGKLHQGPLLDCFTTAMELNRRDTCFDRKFEIDFSPVSLELKASNLENVLVKMATAEEIKIVNQMIYQSSKSGRGFAIDEFNHSNQFAGRMLQRVAVLVAKDANNTILAGVVLGPTNYCRSASTDNLSAYVIVSEQHRRQGIGKHLVKALLAEVAKRSDYNGIISDVFMTDLPAVLFCKAAGFAGVGSVVDSGTMAGYQLTDTLVIFYPTPMCNIVHSKI